MKTITERDREKEISMMSKVILSLLIILVWCPSSFTTTYYVSKQGNDENSGTSWANAWTTVSKVTNTNVSGDTVFFGTGVFRGQLRPCSGTESAPTVYACSSWTQGIAEIWGSDSVTGWTQYSGNVYRANWNSSGYLVWDSNDDAAVLGQKDGTCDTLLRAVTSIAAVNAAGLYYHDQGNNQLYVWKVGGGDPDHSDMEASGRPTIMFTGQDWVEIWGFRVRYGHYGGILFAGNWDPNNHCTIERCHVTRCATHAGENACCIGALGPVTPYGTYNVIRACTVGYAIEWDNSYGGHNYAGHLSKGMNWYATRHLIVESCVVIADNDGAPRGHTGMDGKGWAQYHTYRFNTVYSGYERGISIYSEPYHDSVYGNIIIGDISSDEQYGIFWGPPSGGGDSCVVWNNTVYGFVTSGIEMGEDGDWNTQSSIKYNVVHAIDRSVMQMLLNNTHNQLEIDSNMYYTSGTPSFIINWGDVNWNTWRSTYEFDNNGTNNVDPGFAAPAAGNFSRPNASGEMNRIYGGKSWTVFGAVQPGDSVPVDTIPPNQIQDVQVGSVTPNSATITWTTILLSTPQVCYGQSTSLGQCTPEDLPYVMSHSVTLTGLESNTTYYYQPRICDQYGNVMSGPILSFTTLQSFVQIIKPAETLFADNATPISWNANGSAPLPSRVLYRVSPGAGTLTNPNGTHLMLWR
jgi:hypothetical protein